MQNFDFYAPTYFAFGKKAEERSGELCKRFHASKVLLHYGGGSAQKSGLLDRIKKSLSNSNIDFVELGGVQPNPVDSLVYEGIEQSRKEKIDFILAVGGGSVIDSAKAIACGIPYQGDFWDFYSQKAEVKEAVPLGVVLTIAAAGSEGSEGSVITKEDGLLKRSAKGDVLRPAFSILNPELTYTLPTYQTACGATDIMAHILERYCSQTQGVDLTDHICEALLKVMIQQTPIALKDPGNYEARANIMWAGMMAHNDIAGVGRQGDWSSHQLEHELSALYGVAHGAGLAVMFPAWMRYQYKHNVMLFAQLAQRVWGCEMNFRNPEITALEGIERFEEFLKSISMPISFQELGAKEEDIPILVEKCKLNNGGDYMGYFHPLKREELANVYKMACK